MTEVIKEVLKFGFENIPELIRIYAEPYAYNTASRRVLEKVGFELEVTMKDNILKNGVL